ncbi:hypothetical protein STEG23_006649 [Scotinomys teguina]
MTNMSLQFVHFFSALVLEVQSDLVSGGRLAVHKPVVILEEEKQVKGPEGTQMQNDALIPGNASTDTLDSHARAHLRMEACCRMLKYAWQDPSYNLADDGSLPKKTEKEFFENVQPQKKHSHFPKHSKLQRLRHQEFEYRDGQIISLAAPQLVLGIQGSKPRSGTEVILVERKSDDGHQCWIHKEESRTQEHPDAITPQGPRSTRTPSHRKLPQLHPRTQEHPDAITPQGPKSTRTPSHHKDPGTPDTIRLGGPRCNQTILDQENPEVLQTSLDQEIPEAPIIL